MKKIEIVVLSIVFFVLCAAPSVSCAEDTVHYEVIGGDTLVILSLIHISEPTRPST